MICEGSPHVNRLQLAGASRLGGFRGHLGAGMAGEDAGTTTSLLGPIPVSSADQSCLLNSQIAGTRNTTPKAAITTILVSTG